MPVYQYVCSDCGYFDSIAPIANARESTPCPVCEKSATRILSAPYLGAASRSMIKAAGLNELAQNEPKHSSQVKASHPAGCGCCSGSGTLSRQTRKNAAGDKMFPAKRPWMISH